MTIYNDHFPSLEAFISDVQRLGYKVIRPQSPVHLEGVKSECLIISTEADYPADPVSGDYSTFHLKLDFNKFNFYGSYLSNYDAPFAITKPNLSVGRNYADVILFAAHQIFIERNKNIHYQHNTY